MSNKFMIFLFTIVMVISFQAQASWNDYGCEIKYKNPQARIYQLFNENDHFLRFQTVSSQDGHNTLQKIILEFNAKSIKRPTFNIRARQVDPNSFETWLRVNALDFSELTYRFVRSGNNVRVYELNDTTPVHALDLDCKLESSSG